MLRSSKLSLRRTRPEKEGISKMGPNGKETNPNRDIRPPSEGVLLAVGGEAAPTNRHSPREASLGMGWPSPRCGNRAISGSAGKPGQPVSVPIDSAALAPRNPLPSCGYRSSALLRPRAQRSLSPHASVRRSEGACAWRHQGAGGPGADLLGRYAHSVPKQAAFCERRVHSAEHREYSTEPRGDGRTAKSERAGR